MANYNKTKSFTLIEILIVTTLILVMSGTSLALFSSFRDEKTLENQVTLFKSAIEVAINKATAGDVSLCSAVPTPHVAGYSLIVNSTDIVINPQCDTVPSPIKYPIPSNIKYLTPTFSLQFNYINYQGETRVFPMKNTDTGKCKYVQIDETGVITNGDMPCP